MRPRTGTIPNRPLNKEEDRSITKKHHNSLKWFQVLLKLQLTAYISAIGKGILVPAFRIFSGWEIFNSGGVLNADERIGRSVFPQDNLFKRRY
jgi:hypothetical protein